MAKDKWTFKKIQKFIKVDRGQMQEKEMFECKCGAVLAHEEILDHMEICFYKDEEE